MQGSCLDAPPSTWTEIPPAAWRQGQCVLRFRNTTYLSDQLLRFRGQPKERVSVLATNLLIYGARFIDIEVPVSGGVLEDFTAAAGAGVHAWDTNVTWHSSPRLDGDSVGTAGSELRVLPPDKWHQEGAILLEILGPLGKHCSREPGRRHRGAPLARLEVL
jgi:hypothetical protein